MKQVTLLNAPILTSYGIFKFEPLTIERAKKIVHEAEKVESSIGHIATAEVITEDLEFPVSINRNRFEQTIDDIALIFKLKSRVGEGKILDKEEIRNIDYEFCLLTRIK